MCEDFQSMPHDLQAKRLDMLFLSGVKSPVDAEVQPSLVRAPDRARRPYCQYVTSNSSQWSRRSPSLSW